MDCSMPGYPGLDHLRELAQTHVNWVCDAIQPSHPLLPPFPHKLRSFVTSRSFPVTWLFSSGSQSIGASPSASVIPMNIQDWFPLGLTGLTSFQFKSLLQHHSSKASILWYLAFLLVQLSHLYRSAGKTIALTMWNFVGKVMSLIFNILSRFV